MNIDWISFLDYHAGAITAVATAILVGITAWYAISTNRILKEAQVARKLSDIEYQLANVYSPMRNVLEKFKNSIFYAQLEHSPKGPILPLTPLHDLQSEIMTLINKDTGTLDEKVMHNFYEFFKKDHSELALEEFIDAVTEKIDQLKNDKQKYLSYKV